MVGQQIGNAKPLMIIIVEPGVGYLIPVLRKQHPQATLIALHFNAALRPFCQWNADHSRSIGHTQELEEFLLGCISRLPSPRIATIIPHYLNDVANEVLPRLTNAISNSMRVARSDLATVGRFGKQWVSNSIANTLFCDHTVQFAARIACPICIVGSGPTLNETIETLITLQHHALIFALPSALLCLDEHGIAVDLVVNTDSGFWATAHFQARQRTTMPRIAMPLTAARGLYRERTQHTLLFHQQFGLEQELAALFQPALPALSAYGTVAASAIEIAHRAQARQILLFGIDGAYMRGALHCRPHSFEHYYLRDRSLLRPIEQELLSRLIRAPRAEHPSEEVRILRAHAIYRQELQAIARRLASTTTAGNVATTLQVVANHENTLGIPSISAQQALRECAGSSKPDERDLFRSRPQSPSVATKRKAIVGLLRTYRQRIESATQQRQAHSERRLHTLMHALAPQQFHAFWKTHAHEQWHALQQQCAHALQLMEERYR